MQYDAKVIVEFADKLYAKAKSIVAAYTLFGFLLGCLGGAAINQTGGLGAVAALILGVIGYAMGTDKAFQLRLQAQTALCQVQIEQNTRPRT